MAKFTIRFNYQRQHIELPATEQSNLLELLRKEGIPTRNPCRNGVCGLCRCQLLAGAISYGIREPHGLWESHREQGFILPCIAYPESDLILDNLSVLED